MGKGRAPTALENYLINKQHLYSLPSMEERAESYAEDYGVSYDEAVEHFKKFDADYYHRSDD